MPDFSNHTFKQQTPLSLYRVYRSIRPLTSSDDVFMFLSPPSCPSIDTSGGWKRRGSKLDLDQIFGFCGEKEIKVELIDLYPYKNVQNFWYNGFQPKKNLN